MITPVINPHHSSSPENFTFLSLVCICSAPLAGLSRLCPIHSTSHGPSPIRPCVSPISDISEPAHVLFLVLLTGGPDPPSGRSSPLPLRPDGRPVTPPLSQTPKHFHVPGRSWSASCHCSSCWFSLFMLIFGCYFNWSACFFLYLYKPERIILSFDFYSHINLLYSAVFSPKHICFVFLLLS